mgnify:CR=1 FL=1
MATLVYSERCKYSIDIIKFIHENPILGRIVQFHDIAIHGVPKHIERVPTLVTTQGNYIIGGDIKQWLIQMIPQPEIESQGPSMSLAGFDSPGDEWASQDMFCIDDYGRSLQPMITPDLEMKINTSVQDAFKKENR